MPLVYRAQVRLLLPILSRGLMSCEILGRENVPGSGPIILASNHVDNWDPYISNLALSARSIHHFARANGMQSWALGRYWRMVGAIPANGDGFRQALSILREGGTIGIYPEGRIGPALAQTGPGAALLSLRSGAPIIPVAVFGTERIHAYSFLRRPRVTLCFGPPLFGSRNTSVEAFSHKIASEIAAMLPPAYRGFYSNPVNTELPARRERLRRDKRDRLEAVAEDAG
jgi:1-acyl-sn-glycerol-3-phosphate acyltransferase